MGPAGPGAAVGSAIIDFGAGGQVAETVVADATVTASTTIVPNIAGSTADNNEFVHSALPARVGVTVNPGVGYTLRVVSDWRVTGTLNVVFLRG